MDSDELFEELDQEDEDDIKFDCQSIVSTYTNTDNHPGVIKRLQKKKELISLDK